MLWEKEMNYFIFLKPFVNSNVYKVNHDNYLWWDGLTLVYQCKYRVVHDTLFSGVSTKEKLPKLTEGHTLKKLVAALFAATLVFSSVGSFVFNDQATTVEAKGYKSGKKASIRTRTITTTNQQIQIFKKINKIQKQITEHQLQNQAVASWRAALWKVLCLVD